MKRFSNLILATALFLPAVALAAETAAETDASSTRAEYQAMLEEAERARMQAETARREAVKAAELAREAARKQSQQTETEARQSRAEAEQLEREREMRQREVERVREELSKAHRELREAQREVARAHREVTRSSQAQREFRVLNLGDRAVIGVVLGAETEEGVKIVGVSPDGPAERAGIEAGDVIAEIAGNDLSGADHKGREAIYRVMEGATAGEELAVTIVRNGKKQQLTVTPEQREPLAWQSMISIVPEAPEAPDAPDAPDAPPAPEAPNVLVERIVVPDVDTEKLEARVHKLTKDLQGHKFTVVVPDDMELDENGDFEFPESFDLEFQGYSDLAEQAMHDANIWFGLPLSQGLELATVNQDLGAYFKTDRGVLVIRAKEDNAYQLKSGDVVLNINKKTVDTPADMMRALREVEPGSELAIGIKRDRKDRTITVTMPENRLGYSWSSDGNNEDM